MLFSTNFMTRQRNKFLKKSGTIFYLVELKGLVTATLICPWYHLLQWVRTEKFSRLQITRIVKEWISGFSSLEKVLKALLKSDQARKREE